MASVPADDNPMTSLIWDLERVLARADEMQLYMVGAHLSAALEAATKVASEGPGEEMVQEANVTPPMG